MRSIRPRACSLLLGLSVPLACGGSDGHLFPNDTRSADESSADVSSSGNSALQAQVDPSTFPFIGAGSSGAAQPLTPGLGPETSGTCDPVAASSSAQTVQHVCFYAQDDQTALAASVEQVVEVVGTAEWVHLRLTLNPDFVDNTYGANAVGWGTAQGPNGPGAAAGGALPPAPPGPPGAPSAGPPPAGASQPPAPPPGDAARPVAPPPPAATADAGPPAPGAAPPPGDHPPARPRSDDSGAPGGAVPPPLDGPPPGPDAGPPPLPGDAPAPPAAAGKDAAGPKAPGGPGGHTFNDLVGSDHAELELLDADGNVAMAFWLDYVSAAASAPSGYASLGVSGGEGRLSVGEPDWILAATTSLDRSLNACGLSSFVTDSPATDADYTPNADASAWDYRVSYEVWISTDAFGDAGFGSALIQLVHASPSKQGGATLEVVPGSCPADPDRGDAPEPLPPVLETIR